MASNLPPGCGSYDGGIDHELESAIEALVDRIETARTAQMLINFLDAVEATYSAGYADGQMDKRMEQDSRDEPRHVAADCPNERLVSRERILLRAAYDILKKCDALGETAFYDDTDCDGYCLATDIAEVLGIEPEDFDG